VSLCSLLRARPNRILLASLAQGASESDNSTSRAGTTCMRALCALLDCDRCRRSEGVSRYMLDVLNMAVASLRPSVDPLPNELLAALRPLANFACAAGSGPVAITAITLLNKLALWRNSLIKLASLRPQLHALPMLLAHTNSAVRKSVLQLIVHLSAERESCTALLDTNALQGALDLLVRVRLTLRPGGKLEADSEPVLASRFLQNIVAHDSKTLALFREHPAVAGLEWQAWAQAVSERDDTKSAYEGI